MANTLKVKKNTQSRSNKRFLAVDLYQKFFSDISVKAVYDIYAQKKNISVTTAERKPFSHCLEFLRRLESTKNT